MGISMPMCASVTHSRVSVHVINMKLLVLAACVALAAAWTPGPRDLCNDANTNGGSILLPHEKYCQLYYTCDLRGNQVELFCPGRMLFAYGTGIAVCVTEGFSTFNCPKWSCSSDTDIGRRYPDTCCSKYWECTAANKLSEKVCPPGTKFDTSAEACLVQAQCSDNKYCVDNIRSSNNNACRNSASPSGDPCLYRSEGWPDDRQCPIGTSFDIATCSCSQFNQGCTASGLSADQLLTNKNPDVQCRASGRMQWNNNLSVVSDKLGGRNVDHYFFKSAGFSANSLEGSFDNTNNAQPYIYDYYYNDNTLYAPLAISMMVRFDDQNIVLTTEYVLLENRWTIDPSNTHCDSTIRIAASYTGVNRGDRTWQFTVSATGENNVVSRGSANISGSIRDYFRIVFTFGTTFNNQIGIGGSVTNRGQSGQISGQSAQFQTDQRNMGSALRPTKCGFAIGRGLTGKIREFNVYEGCSNFQLL